MSTIRRFFLVALVAVASLLGSAPAGAEIDLQKIQPGMFSPQEGDSSVDFMRHAFGAIVSKINPGGQDAGKQTEDPLAAGMETFNAGVLLLSVLFVIYTTIRGTIDSAHDGELLGRKMNSTWVPLRSLAGFGALTPLPGGYSLVQIAVLWIALQGVGMADTVWARIMDELAQTGMIAAPRVPEARQLAANILRSEVCMAAMNKQWEAEGRPDRITLTERTSARAAQAAADAAAQPGAVALDGSARLAQSVAEQVHAYHTRAFVWGGGKYVSTAPACGALEWRESDESREGNANGNIARAPILVAHGVAVKRMILDLRPVAEAIVAGAKPAPGALDDAARRYEKTLTQAAKTATAATGERAKTEFIQFAKQGGWIYAGTYYNQITRLNDSMQGAINALPTPVPIAIEAREMRETLINYRDGLAVADAYIEARSDAPRAAYEHHRETVASTTPKSWEDVQRIISLGALAVIDDWTQGIAGSNLSHIGQMKALGSSLINFVYGSVLTIGTVAGVANAKGAEWTLGLGFSVAAVISTVAPFLMTLLGILFVGGCMLAFYVPMIPYFAWVVGLIKWLVMVVENVIAAPVWAAAHVHPDGSDTVGRAGPGYFIILSTFLRPALMVFGFVLSITLAQPVAAWINTTWITAVTGATDGTMAGLAAIVSYTLMYAVIMTIVVHSIFSLVNYLPDSVLRWLGHAVGAGAIGDSEGSQAQHVIGGATHAVAGAAGAAAGAAAGKATGKQPAASKTNDQLNAELLGPSK